jgi:WXG100 family type VII secretion target
MPGGLLAISVGKWRPVVLGEMIQQERRGRDEAMTLVGLDVDEVRRLAQDLHAQAGHIGDVIARVDRLLQTLGSSWRGPDAEQFRDRWVHEHAPAMRHAREAVEHLSDSAVRNADEQERASSGGQEMSAAGSNGSVSVPKILSTVTSVTNVEVNGVRPWDLITSLGAAGEINGIKGFGIVGIAGDAVQVIDYADKVAKGDFDLLDGFDVVADVMQNYPVVGELGGAAIHIWADAARAAMEADWSGPAMSQTWEYMRDNPGVVAEEFGKATMLVGSKMLGYLGIP